jgi:hypothetical protein
LSVPDIASRFRFQFKALDPRFSGMDSSCPLPASDCPLEADFSSKI